MILITTVRHTGTHSLMAELNVDHSKRSTEWDQFHCDLRIFELIKSGKFSEVHTTYRDPVEVAVSWLKRAKTPKVGDNTRNSWSAQWLAWSEITHYARVHHMHELSEKLNSIEKDTDLSIPPGWIEHAEACVAKAKI